MMNFRRLANSPLLLDGFEEFVRHWLANPEPAPVPEPDDYLKAWLMVMPIEVTTYWQIANRWPDASLKGSQDQFVGFVKTWQEIDPAKPRLALVIEGESSWIVYYDVVKKKLVVQADLEDPLVELPCTVGQFLVTFGLFNIVIAYQGSDMIWDGPVPLGLSGDAIPIWDGCYPNPGMGLTFQYISESNMLFWDVSNSSKDQKSGNFVTKFLRRFRE